MKKYIDKKSGREIVKLTESGVNCHLYFTDNSFTVGSDDIYYIHCDGNLKEKNLKNELMRLNVKTGESELVADFSDKFEKVAWQTKSPDSEYFIFKGDGDLYSLHVPTKEYKLLYRCPVGYTLGHASLSCDKRYIAIDANKNVDTATYTNENYGGFKEMFYAKKNSSLIIVRMDGTGGDVVFEDTHWMGHVQFAPDTNEYITYCHEGPWNYVQQRIWMFNTITRHVKPCYVQAENDSIGHEFWTRDGLVFFDNRGRGHDGTITSDKTQAVTVDPAGEDDIPVVGFADKECNILKTMELPYYCNHYHANPDNTLLVADAVEDIVLIDISKKEPSIETLCAHNTSWRWQAVHCHPCWSWEGDKVLFASDCEKEGEPQLYLINMK